MQKHANRLIVTHPTDLLVSERQIEIRRRLEISERVIAGNLAQEFGVSEDTIRRDLREMAAAGECVRVYGGAISNKAKFVPLQGRLDIQADQKRLLAQKSVEVLERGTFVFLDVGSTNLAMCPYIPVNLDLTIATNSPHIAAALMANTGVKLITIGGKIDANTGAAISASAVQEAVRLHPDLLIMGACGLNKRSGITAFDQDDAFFKQTISANSTKILVPLLNDKIDTVAPFSVIPIQKCDYLVVEHSLSEVTIASLRSSKTTVLRASKGNT